MRKVYESAIVVSGDAKGGIKAVKLTSDQIKALDKDLRKVNKTNSTFKKKFDDSSISIGGFRSALLSVTTIGAARYFTESADAMKNIDARLKIATGSLAEFNIAQSELARISLETHSSLDTTSRLYTRMQQSLGDIAVTQSELLTVTQSINQAFAVSGATAQEAQAAIIQMTQALASGQLRGEEYRSVSEQATRILQVLQDELGKTRGELLLMAHSGQLSSEIVINAMLNQSAVLQSEFSKLPLTVERSITDLDTNFKIFVKGLDSAVNATSIMANSIKFLGENLSEIGVFIAAGLFAKLAVKVIASARSVIAYTAAFGAAETATLGMSTAVSTLNKRLSLLGGVWGIALFAGIEFFSWLTSQESEIEKFSDEYEDAMQKVEKASKDGFGIKDVDVFKDAIDSTISEIDRLNQKLDDLRKPRPDISPALSGKEALLFGAARAQSEIANDGKISQLQGKYEELRQSMERSIAAIKSVDDSFGPLDETMVRHRFNVAQLGSVQGTLLSAWNLTVAASSSLISQQEKANKSVEDWAVSTQKSIKELDKQIATFNQSKEEITLYEASLLDVSKASDDFKKVHVQLNSELQKKVNILKKLKKDHRQLKEDQRKQAAEEKKLNRERLNRLNQLNRDLSQAISSLDPLASLTSEYESQIDNLNQAIKDGSIGVEKYLESHNLLTVAFNQQKEEIKTSETVFSDLIEEMDRELAIQKAVGDEKLRLIAIRELENNKIEATEERIASLVQRYKEELSSGSGGAFGAGIEGFGDLLRNAFSSIGKEGTGFFQTMANGFSNMTSSAENFAEGLSSTIGFVSQLGDIWNRNSLDGRSGFDTAFASFSEIASSGALGPIAQIIGTIANVVDSLTGGKLFGTAFELESAQSNLVINQGGVGGFLEQTLVRERSWFRGREWQTRVTALEQQALNGFNDIFDQIIDILANAAEVLDLDDIPAFVSGLFRQNYDSEGNLTSEFSEINGRTFNESQDQFALRLMGENIIAAIDQALPQVIRTFTERTFHNEPVEGPGDYDFGFGFWTEEEVTRLVDEADFIAERWRHDASLLLEGSQFLLLASERIVSGVSIFESLTSAADFVEQNAAAGETMSETFQRAVQSHELFTLAIQRIGTEFSLAGDDLIQFSVDFVEAAGGIDRASSLVSNYFDSFYSDQENTSFRIRSLFDSAQSQLGDLGLDQSIGIDQFRQLFESMINELPAEDLAAWLEAGNALAALNNEIQILVQAEEEYLGFINGFREQLLRISGSDFQLRMYDLDVQLQNNIDSANQLAIAAGRSGASVEDLAVIQAAYAAQTDLLVDELRLSILDLANQLYGEDLDSLILDLESQQQSSIQSVNNTALEMWQNQVRAVQSISNMIDSLLLNDQLSPLSRTEQFNEAFGQFNELLALAQGGDADAMAELPGMAQTLLTIARDVFASGSDYNDIFDTVLAGLSSIGVTIGQPSQQQQSTTVLVPSEELKALYLEREQRDAELYAQQRLRLATQLAQHLADLAGFVERPVFDLADELGVSMAALAEDLGINVQEMTIETVGQLVNLANTLNVELVDLAESLGEDVSQSLGSLSDDMSLINDALESAINGLPEESADFLTPFLEAIENATNEADANAAIAEMEAAINTLPANQANELAAFFDNINYRSEFDQQLAILEQHANATIDSQEILGRIVDAVNDQDEDFDAVITTQEQQIDILESIDGGIQSLVTAMNSEGAAQAQGSESLPQFDSGVRKLQSDVVAQLHKGETVLPASVVDSLEKFGIPVQQPKSNDKAAIAAMMESNSRVIESIMQLKQAIKESSEKSSDTIASAINQQNRSIYQ